MRLTLEQLEAERGEVEPFEVDLGDEVITLQHPKDLPFESLINFDGAQPDQVLRVLMGADTFEALADNPRVTLGVLESILTGYYAHYGLGGPGEGDASLRSVRSSAKPSRRTSPRRATA